MKDARQHDIIGKLICVENRLGIISYNNSQLASAFPFLSYAMPSSSGY